MMQEKDVHVGQRVVTNNGHWGTVIGRTCCWTDHGEHGDHVRCNNWDGWWYVCEDNGGDPHVMQNAERMSLHGTRMWDGSFFPEYNDPRATG